MQNSASPAAMPAGDRAIETEDIWQKPHRLWGCSTLTNIRNTTIFYLNHKENRKGFISDHMSHNSVHNTVHFSWILKCVQRNTNYI